MSFLTSFENNIGIINDKIENAFTVEVSKKYQQVEKEASKTIGSFSRLVDELMQLKQLSTGTKAKEQITKLASELNNSSVFFAKMISNELGQLYGIINTNDTSKAESTEETV